MPTSSPEQAGCYAVAAVLLVFSTAAVGSRLFVRRMKRVPIGIDDISISLSLVSVRHFLVVVADYPQGRQLIIRLYSCSFGHLRLLSSMVKEGSSTMCKKLSSHLL